MDRIWVGRAGQKLGPFSPAGILVAERQRRLGAGDLLWWPGLSRPVSLDTGLAAVRAALAKPPAPPRVAPLDERGAESIPVLTQVEDAPSPRELDYAGFEVRLAAAAIDGAIVAGAVLAVLIVGMWIGAPAEPGLARASWLRSIGKFGWWLAFVAGAAYYVLQEAGPYAATIGKRWLGLEVRHAYTRAPIGIGRAAARYLARLASAVPLFAGFFMQIYTLHRQTLHDRIACTVVLAAQPVRRDRLRVGYALAAVVPVVVFAAWLAQQHAILRAENVATPSAQGTVREAPRRPAPSAQPKRPVVPDFERGK